MRKQQLWPRGTGQWTRVQTVIVARDDRDRAALASRVGPDEIVVATPLELIQTLTNEQHLISCVVLVGSSPANRDIVEYLAEVYPMIRVVEQRPEPVRELGMQYATT